MKAINEFSSVRRAQIFLKDHGLQKESWARRICLLFVDLGLLGGLAYYVYIIQSDWDYWETFPLPFHFFIVIQYILIAMALRVPIIDMR